jgi:hypothetical protein
MGLYNIPNMSGGIDDTLIDLATEVQALPIGLLIFTFLVVLLGGTAQQTRRTGSADWSMWSLMASLSVLLLSLLMTTRAGLIDMATLGIVVALNVLAGIWFFMSSGRNEA